MNTLFRARRIDVRLRIPSAWRHMFDTFSPCVSCTHTPVRQKHETNHERHFTLKIYKNQTSGGVFSLFAPISTIFGYRTTATQQRLWINLHFRHAFGLTYITRSWNVAWIFKSRRNICFKRSKADSGNMVHSNISLAEKQRTLAFGNSTNYVQL